MASGFYTASNAALRDEAFEFYPLLPDDVFRATERGEVMPQKSTFFAPKLPTGLVFRLLEGAE